jgi:hypothetical protein
MQTLTPTRRRRLPLTALPSLAVILAGASAQAAVLLSNLDLGGTQQTTTVWENLTGENPTRTPASGSGTITHSSTAFEGTFGFYSFTADYTVSGTQSATFDISSVVWQIECSPNPELDWPYGSGPSLTVVTSSGTEVITPIAFAAGASELRDNFGPDPILYTAFAWQWNLSSIDDTITSITLNAPIGIHTSVTGSQIDVGNSFVQVVIPEPSALLLSFAALPLIARRRRTTV